MPPPLRVLYAEDDPDTRDLICLALERKGFEVVCPDSLHELLKLAKDERWDAYMLDTWMPEISGVDLCKKLREFDPRTPIIFYSAAAYDRDKQDALQCGAQAYIVKPASFDLLVTSLRSAIEAA
jgi:two-component system phosphate regulon response regulator PhoB